MSTTEALIDIRYTPPYLLDIPLLAHCHDFGGFVGSKVITETNLHVILRELVFHVTHENLGKIKNKLN
jgi:hypothetical protein